MRAAHTATRAQRVKNSKSPERKIYGRALSRKSHTQAVPLPRRLFTAHRASHAASFSMRAALDPSCQLKTARRTFSNATFYRRCARPFLSDKKAVRAAQRRKGKKRARRPSPQESSEKITRERESKRKSERSRTRKSEPITAAARGSSSNIIIPKCGPLIRPRRGAAVPTCVCARASACF